MKIVGWSGLLGLACLCLTACSTPGEEFQRDEATCLGQGLQRNTDGFADCVRQQDLKRYGQRQPVRFGPAPSSW